MYLFYEDNRLCSTAAVEVVVLAVCTGQPLSVHHLGIGKKVLQTTPLPKLYCSVPQVMSQNPLTHWHKTSTTTQPLLH